MGCGAEQIHGPLPKLLVFGRCLRKRRFCEGFLGETVDNAQPLLDSLSDLDDPWMQENALLRYDDKVRETFVAMSGIDVSESTW